MSCQLENEKYSKPVAVHNKNIANQWQCTTMFIWVIGSPVRMHEYSCALTHTQPARKMKYTSGSSTWVIGSLVRTHKYNSCALTHSQQKYSKPVAVHNNVYLGHWITSENAQIQLCTYTQPARKMKNIANQWQCTCLHPKWSTKKVIARGSHVP